RGADPAPSAPSSSRPFAPLARSWSELEFRIKWARQSYRECTWRSHASLASSRGFKKVLNYAKRAEERAAWARAATPEELELAGVSAAMEEELVSSYEKVERVVAARWSLFEEEEAEEVKEEEELLDSLLQQPNSFSQEPNSFSQQPNSSSPRAPQPHQQYLVKWQGLPYAEATWESAARLHQSAEDREAVEAYRQRRARESEARVSVTAARRAFAGTGKRALEAQPACLKGGQLRDYQLQGLNWMTYCWSRDANAILADEMGLGKTVQCASLLGYLFEELRLAGPALVVVPLSVAANWAREFRTWTPQLNVVLYIGDAASRAVIRAFELRGMRDMGFRDPGVDWARVEERLAREDAAAAAPPDVLLTTYELALKDADILRGVRWNYFMVDEAHRLKNEGSALYRELSSWRLANKLLITGTPLQNSLRELWALLTFLTPGAWGEPDDFAETYDAASPDAVARLHAALRPCLLRRVIREVERSLPPKTERVLKVGMTPLQKQYYRWILTRNFAELNKGARGGQVTLLNVIMDLKKCCNHPFLFESAEENYRRSGSDADTQVDVLARTSGKLALLDRLLARLKADGHRVLVFSQMVRMLDILADYCRLRGYSAQRLDGSTPAAARASAMERFNAPGSPDFIFLLSTRAGGLGINLATADTVVIFDSDWNPQNDLQAMSRAHRIGQKGAVAIYRFVTAATVEESILERAKSKMMLDDVVIQRMDTSGRTVLQPDKSKPAGGMFGKDELAAILRCGAAQLFGEGKDEGGKQEDAAEARQEELSQAGPTSQALVTEDDLDAILQRAEVLDEASRAQDLGSHMLDGFSNVSTFASEETDADFWKKLIPEEEQRKARQAAADEEEEPLVRTARLRALEALGADPAALTLGAKRKLSEDAGG
ncbi:SNF2 family domain-containing protein, partial [Helicosporidium sp. ATCC 50920]